MSCKFPMWTYYNKENKETLFVQGRINMDDFYTNDYTLCKKYSWFGKHSDFILQPNTKKMLIPCGRCTECRLQKTRETATRIVLEALDYTDNWCITLTYDDSNLTYGSVGIIISKCNTPIICII